jgi:hypothetical protein
MNVFLDRGKTRAPGGQLVIRAVTGKVGPDIQLTGKPTHQELEGKLYAEDDFGSQWRRIQQRPKEWNFANVPLA